MLDAGGSWRIFVLVELELELELELKPSFGSAK